MNLVREHINEKFEQHSDPIKDIGIGLYIKRNFEIVDQASDWIIKIIPAIYDLDEIPKNIVTVHTKNIAEFNEEEFMLHEKYIKLEKYIKKYISVNELGHRIYNEAFIIQDIYRKLHDMGYPSWNDVSSGVFEKFEQESDPIKDLKIGGIKLIKDWLEEHSIFDYVINDDGTINVNGDVDLKRNKLTEFPEYIQFNKINGNFSVQYNLLTSLRGCPRIVECMFSCSNNNLTSLEYAPKEAGSFYCHHNKKRFTESEILKFCNVKDKRIHVS